MRENNLQELSLKNNSSKFLAPSSKNFSSRKFGMIHGEDKTLIDKEDMSTSE
jgi:hypothetical protein